nr:hypothetical protein 4 [Gammaproteobacteria bacterium]
MRGTVAKRLRKFAKADTPHLTTQVVYTTVRLSHNSPNKTVVLDQCQRQYYKLLKRIWKL